MTARPKEMTKTQRAMYDAVLETLKANDCIRGYTIQGQSVSAEWSDGGFDRAFHELTSNAKPFGLKNKKEKAILLIVLRRENKERVDASITRGFKEQYGLNLSKGSRKRISADLSIEPDQTTILP